ncbi:MAG: MurR/RpiR family transcriptional regulator [Lachnospiraceae bacterium]|nr:MurR/RpiR family transcriptional regulator [Lachnospiraceae bacterium]
MGLVKEILENDSLTEREQSIRTYLVTQPEKLYNMTARDLGEATYSSAAAVTRFCKKLGCRGYQDFRIRFLQDVGELKGVVFQEEKENHLPDDARMAMMARKAAVYRSAIDLIMRENYPERFEKAVRVIKKADYLDFYACDVNACLGGYAASLFLRCGKRTSLFAEPYMQLGNALDQRPGHLAVLVSFTGDNSHLADLSKLIREGGTKVLCFAGAADCSLAKISDYCLIVPNGENVKGIPAEDRETLFSTAFKYLVDTISSALREERDEAFAMWDEQWVKRGSDAMWGLDMCREKAGKDVFRVGK